MSDTRAECTRRLDKLENTTRRERGRREGLFVVARDVKPMLTYFERYTARGWREFTPYDVEQALIRQCRARVATTRILPEGQLDHEIDPAVERYRRPLTITDVAWLESMTPAGDFADNDLASLSHPEAPVENASTDDSLRAAVGAEHEYGRRLTIVLKESLEGEPKLSGSTILGWIGGRHVDSLIQAMSGWPLDRPQDPCDEDFRVYLGRLVRHGLI
ncbi:MAG: hypothetical protein LBG11_05445 [Bifidobacteriaceae bacterium]|nr:hypothetical protein [Bifidobacteriaceae bacterium]